MAIMTMLSDLMTNKKKLLGVTLGLIGIVVLIVAIRQQPRKKEVTAIVSSGTAIKSQTTSEPADGWMQTDGVSAWGFTSTSLQWVVIGCICIFGGSRLLEVDHGTNGE